MLFLMSYMVISILCFLEKASAQCQFPSSLRGNWLRSRDGLTLSFTSSSASGFNYESKNQIVDNFNCFMQDDSRYVFRSDKYNNIIPNKYIHIYMCYDMVAVGDNSFYVYELTEKSAEIKNNERGGVFADTIQVNLTDVCTITRNAVQYTTLVKTAVLGSKVNFCPDILLATFNYTQNSLSGCTGDSSLTACNDQSSLSVTPTNCTNEYFGYSVNGSLLCTTFLQFSTITYVTLYNKDATVDNSISYRFTCLAIESSNGGELMITQHPTDCTLGQTGTTVPSPGYSFTLLPSVLCPLPGDVVLESSDNIPLIVGIVMAVIIILALIIIIILLIRCKKSKDRKVFHCPEKGSIISNNGVGDHDNLRAKCSESASNLSAVKIENMDANSTIKAVILPSSFVAGSNKTKKQEDPKKETGYRRGSKAGIVTPPAPQIPNEVFLGANSNKATSDAQGNNSSKVLGNPSLSTFDKKKPGASFQNLNKSNIMGSEVSNHDSSDKSRSGISNKTLHRVDGKDTNAAVIANKNPHPESSLNIESSKTSDKIAQVGQAVPSPLVDAHKDNNTPLESSGTRVSTKKDNGYITGMHVSTTPQMNSSATGGSRVSDEPHKTAVVSANSNKSSPSAKKTSSSSKDSLPGTSVTKKLSSGDSNQQHGVGPNDPNISKRKSGTGVTPQNSKESRKVTSSKTPSKSTNDKNEKRQQPKSRRSTPSPDEASSEPFVGSQRVSVISSVGPASSELFPFKKTSIVSVSSNIYSENGSIYNDAKHLLESNTDTKKSKNKGTKRGKKKKATKKR